MTRNALAHPLLYRNRVPRTPTPTPAQSIPRGVRISFPSMVPPPYPQLDE